MLAGSFYRQNVGGYGITAVSHESAPSLPYGVETGGTLTVSGGADAYSLHASNGDKLFLRMGAPPSFGPELVLFSPSGALIATNWSPNGPSEISLTVQETGTYLLVAQGHSGAVTGSYGVIAQRMNAPENTALLPWNTQTAGSISFMGCMDTYTVSVNAGEHLDIATGSSIGQDLILFAPDGSELTRSSSALGTTILSATTPATRTDPVLAGSFYRQNVGGYGITAVSHESAPSLPYGVETGGPRTVSGGADAYSLHASNGDKLFLRMGAPPSFGPELVLFSPSGALIATNWSPNGPSQYFSHRAGDWTLSPVAQGDPAL